MNLKNKILYIFNRPTKKRKQVQILHLSCENDKKGSESPYTEMSRENDQKRCVI